MIGNYIKISLFIIHLATRCETYIITFKIYSIIKVIGT